MGQPETNLKNKYERTLKPNQRTFRVNAGFAWAGEVVKRTKKFIMLENPRPFHGAESGVSDLVGFDSIEITPEMVGRKVAVFVATELKATQSDHLNEQQRRFRDMVVNMGGIHREVREDGRVITTSELIG